LLPLFLNVPVTGVGPLTIEGVEMVNKSQSVA